MKMDWGEVSDHKDQGVEQLFETWERFIVILPTRIRQIIYGIKRGYYKGILQLKYRRLCLRSRFGMHHDAWIQRLVGKQHNKDNFVLLFLLF